MNFSENITLTAYNDGDFTIGTPGTINLVNETGAAVQGGNGASSILLITTTGDAGITGGAVAPTIAYTNGSNNINDGIGNNTATFGAQTINDGASPIVTAAKYLDINNDGQVDRIEAQFTENMTVTWADGDWTIAGGTVALNNETAASVPGGNGTTNVVEIVTLGSVNVTGGGTDPTFNYTNNASNINDGNGNDLATTGPITIADAASIVIVSAVYNAQGNGVVDDDVLTVTFSENVDDASLDVSAGGSPTDFLLSGGAFAGASTTASGTANDNVVTITMGSAATAPNVGTDTIKIQTAQIDDTPNNPTLAANPAVTITDGSPPYITAAVVDDANNDGFIDQAVITYNETVTTDYSGFSVAAAGATTFTVNTGSSSGTGTSTITLALIPSGGVPNSSATPDITYAPGNVQDGGGNVALGDTFTGVTEAIEPVVVNVTAAIADGSYPLGTTIPVTVQFSEIVTVTGTPQITPETGPADAVVK